MYKLEYDDDGCLMMVKIEEGCLFSPKAIDAMVARLRSLRDKAWHVWPADRHNRKALEVVIRHGGVKGLFAAGALEIFCFCFETLVTSTFMRSSSDSAVRSPEAPGAAT